MLNNIKATLQQADIPSEAHFAKMSMKDLKSAKVPLSARKHLHKEKH